MSFDAAAATWDAPKGEVSMTDGTAAEDPAAQQAYLKDLWSNIGISAIPGAVQLGMQAVPTSFDIHNKKRMKELEDLRDANKLGLSGSERTQMEQTLLTPVRSLATESRKLAEAQQASLGGTASAADLARIKQRSDAQVQDKAMEAGLRINQANLDMAAQQLQELESRKMHQAEKQKAMLSTVAKTAAGLAPTIGQARAARAVEQFDFAEFMKNNPNATYEDALMFASTVSGLDWRKQKDAVWDSMSLPPNTQPNE